MLLEAAGVLASGYRILQVISSQGPTLANPLLCTSCVFQIRARHNASKNPPKRHPQRVRTLATSSITRAEILPRIKDFTTQFPVSVFQSLSNNPYHNLAIENYILRNSDPSSRIFFTYTNRPCVVIGRNQNPWLECNIAKLQEGLPWKSADWTSYATIYNEDEGELLPASEGLRVPFDLVRRRSGGGTVIHDAGNLNFSAIVPNDKNFTRNVHAQLVVDVLKEYKKSGRHLKEKALFEHVEVNERHDIVMMPRSGVASGKVFKVSGSAFKLTRGRALHHGTLLLASPNIEHRETAHTSGNKSVFSKFLSSSAKTYLEAKGVGSVPSPVHNLFRIDEGMERRNLAIAIEDELGTMFKRVCGDPYAPVIYVDDHDCLQNVNKAIYDDVQEMMTDEWRFCQTPTFEYLSTHRNVKLGFQVKQGVIGKPSLWSEDEHSLDLGAFASLEGKKLHQIQSWDKFLPSFLKEQSSQVIDHLSEVFPAIRLSKIGLEHNSENRIISENPISGEAEGDQNIVKRRSSNSRMEMEQQGQNLVVEK